MSIKLIVTFQQTWHFLYKLLYFIESYPVLYNNYGLSHAFSVMILTVMKIAGFGRTIMETVIGSTIVNAMEHRGSPKAGFYASYNISSIFNMHSNLILSCIYTIFSDD